MADAILKYLAWIDSLHVSAHKGKKVLQLADKVVFADILVSGYQYILIHVGTNDLSELVSTDKIKQYTVHHLMARYRVLEKLYVSIICMPFCTFLRFCQDWIILNYIIR